MNRPSRRGFTLFELTIVLALISVLMGLVVIRFGMGGQRQQVIQTARTLGNLISSYREKAMSEQAIYALILDASSDEYKIVQTGERNFGMANSLPAVKTVRLPESLHFKNVAITGQATTASAILFLDERGILPEVSLAISAESGPSVTLKLDSLVNEVTYDER